MENEQALIRKARRVRFLTWGLSGLGLVIGYLFLYPILVVFYEDRVSLPHWLDDFIEATVFPLEWLYENSRWYHRYIEILGEFLQL